MAQGVALQPPALGRVLPVAVLPPPESPQQRYLRSLRLRLAVVSAAFLILLSHNWVVLQGEKFTYVLLVLLNLLDNSLVYYLTYRGFLVEMLSYFRLALDAFAITFLCHITGSVSSVTPVTYVIVICATAFLLDRRHTLFVAGAFVVGYEILLILEYKGILAYATLAPALRINPREELLTVATNAIFMPVFLIMSGILVSHLAAQSQKTERQLRSAHSELARASGELVNAQTQLARSEKLASLGTLVAGVAHELNNPIGFLSSNLEMLESYAGRLEKFAVTTDETERVQLARELRIDVVREELPSLIEDCKDAARRCREIVEGLKDFSRPALKRPRIVLLEEIVEKSLRLISPQMKDRIRVARAFSLNEPVRCYPGQLAQVLTNLLINAVQAIEGKGDIVVETGGNTRGEVFIRVHDSGKGIAPENLTRIFDPFFTTKEPGQGTGLGLAVSYSIVAEHGGRLEVESTSGEGTTFSVILPRNAVFPDEAGEEAGT